MGVPGSCKGYVMVVSPNSGYCWVPIRRIIVLLGLYEAPYLGKLPNGGIWERNCKLGFRI